MRPKRPKGQILNVGTTLASTAHATASVLTLDLSLVRQPMKALVEYAVERDNESREKRHREELVRQISREPLALLFSRMAGWLSAVLLSSARRPDLVQTLTFVPAERRWRLSIIVDGEAVFEGLSSHVGQLAIDAERAFRDWADNEDRKENEARLEASVTDLRKE